MKKLSALLPIIVMGVFVSPARAGRTEPTSIPCWLFRGEKLELQQTCITESHTWTGGGIRLLRWEDGAQTTMAWGLQGRGERPCADTSIDSVCGLSYQRHPATLKRISQAEQSKLASQSQPTIACVEVQNKSVCWMRTVR